MSRLIQILLVLSLGSPAWAELRLPALFSDGMVLQHNRLVPVWGWAGSGEKVTVLISEQSFSTTTDEHGKWALKLAPMPVSAQPLDIVIKGETNTITLRNVLFGEVWLASGQSNMEWDVKRSMDAEKNILEADYPQIRMFTVVKHGAEEPLDDVEGQWQVCNSDTVPGFSAAAYYFALDLHQRLGVPIGIIHSSWGGTAGEQWTPMDILESDPDYQAIIERFKHRAAANQDSIATYERKLATWRTAAEQARAEGKPEPSGRPLHPLGRVICRPGALYNAMIAPLIPYAIQGVIWYQGESNASRAAQYKKLFPNMILSWRRAWGQGDFPFLFVQLANYQQPSAQPDESHWAELREAQTQTLSLVPRTGMAIAIDIGDANDIHPANKQDVGKRLAQCALKVAYGQEVPHTGPIYDHMVVREGKVRLYFKNVAGNLVAKDNQALEGFAIAGQDRQFVWAEARIVDERTIEVSNINVPEPVAVRYAWTNNPICNLYDAAGLPASPFRSDDWATPTTNER